MTRETTYDPVCRHSIPINQICDKCVTLSDAPPPKQGGISIYCSECDVPMIFDGHGGMECGSPACHNSPHYVLGQDVDPINHPPHYTQHPSGVECITITEHYNFNVGNAIKYLWRAGLKDGVTAADDLRKAAWYVQREIERRGKPVRCEACEGLGYTVAHDGASEYEQLLCDVCDGNGRNPPAVPAK